MIVLVRTIDQLLEIYTWVIILRCILSFFPYVNNGLVQLVYAITEPVMAPIRRLLPAAGGMDFSPILVFFLIRLIRQALYSII
jgi:YggT family protein